MEQELINKINELCPEDQGIFVEPFGCDGIIEPLIYMRWITGGLKGGSYHEDSYLRAFDGDGRPQFIALALVLKELNPNLSYLDFIEVENLIHSNEESEYPDYYGNYDEYGIEYIKLSELEQLLEYLGK